MSKKYYALSEVADRYDLTYESIRDWIDKGWIEALRLPSNRLRIPASSLEKIEENMVEPDRDLTEEGVCRQ